MTCCRAVLLAFAVTNLGFSVGTAAQAPPAPMTVPFDFFGVDRDGNPIATLTRDDVAVRIDGRPRAIHSLRWVPVPDPPAGVDARSPVPLPPPFGTNIVLEANRTVILALDDDSLSPGREAPLRAAVDRFVTALAPGDRVSLVTLPYGGLKLDFTSEHVRLRQEVARVTGQASRDESASDLACRTRRTLESLVGLLASLKGGEGPTTVLFFTTRLAAPRRDAPANMAPGMCELTTDHFEQVANAASAARAHFYVIQPEDLSRTSGVRIAENIAGVGFEGSDNPLLGIEHLTGVTSGTQLPLNTVRETTLLRVLRETSGYYALALESDPGDRAGARRSIDVRVEKPDVLLRARKLITVTRDASTPKRPTTAPRAMLRDAGVFRDLPLRVTAYSSREPGETKQLRVMAVMEPVGDVPITAASAGLFDTKGRLVAQWSATAEELTARPIMGAVLVAPGTYRVRAAATDKSGRSGTADYTVVAELVSAGPVTLSALVIGVSQSGSVRPVMEFTKQPVALGFLEIYGKPTGGTIGVGIELAMSPDGPALLTVPAAIAATSDPDRFIATAAIPVGALPRGDVLARAIVQVDGRTTGRVVRTVRKVAP